MNKPPFNHYRFGLTDHQMKQLQPVLDEMDRNARAYGWEIGQGKPLTQVLDFSPDNPFLYLNWRDNVQITPMELYRGHSDFGDPNDVRVNEYGNVIDYGPQFGEEDDRGYDLIGDDGKVVQDTDAPPVGCDQQPEQREDPVGQRWGREITYGSGLLPDEGGAG